MSASNSDGASAKRQRLALINGSLHATQAPIATDLSTDVSPPASTGAALLPGAESHPIICQSLPTPVSFGYGYGMQSRKFVMPVYSKGVSKGPVLVVRPERSKGRKGLPFTFVFPQYAAKDQSFSASAFGFLGFSELTISFEVRGPRVGGAGRACIGPG